MGGVALATMEMSLKAPRRWPGRKGMRVPAVSLRSQLWAPARLAGPAPWPRRTAAAVGWMRALQAALAGGSSRWLARARARVGGPPWAVGGLGLAPGLRMGGRGGAWPGAWPPLPASWRPRASPGLSHRRRHRREHGAPRRPRRAAVARPPPGGTLRYGLELTAELRLGAGVCGGMARSWGPRKRQGSKLPSPQGAQSRELPTRGGRRGGLGMYPIGEMRIPQRWSRHNLRKLPPPFPGSLGTLESKPCDP